MNVRQLQNRDDLLKVKFKFNDRYLRMEDALHSLYN